MRCISGMKGNVSMSTHSSISTMRVSLSARSALGGFLIALLLSLLLSSFAFASSHDSPVPQQDVSRSGVSVVRLLVSYVQVKSNSQSGTPSGPPPAVMQCTGLGVLVSSWAAAGSDDQNNWIVTDGGLVDTGKQATCITSRPTATLSAIQVFLSNGYNSLEPISFTISASPGSFGSIVRCSAQPCSNGSALFGFHTDATTLLPYADVTLANATVPTNAMAIALSRSTLSLELPPAFESNAQKVSDFTRQMPLYLTPFRQAQNVKKEAGTPIVDTVGALVGLSLSNGAVENTQSITKLIQSQNKLKNPPANSVYSGWNTGITSYYKGRYSQAQTAFHQVAQTNKQFQGAQTFEQAAKDASSASGSGNSKPGAKSTPGTSSSGLPWVSGTIDGVPIWLLTIVVLILLVAILVLVSLLFGRKRAMRRRALKEEYAEADRLAAIDAQRIQEMEALHQQQAWGIQPPPLSIAPNSPLPDAPGKAVTQELRCPRCGEMVARSATQCPKCHLWLSPSESGLHLRSAPQMPASPGVPANSIVEQPTLMPASAVPDQPTVEMSPSLSPVNGVRDTDKTVPFGLHRLSGYNLELAVGTRSDRGIKRKHKPNEDSLFAAQAVRTINSLPLNVGLFVIADGMGGHANGQDASRRAIQTIIDFMLPKLMKSSDLQDDTLSRLLSESVQQANQMVHQNNMELHADMGTTVTAALVVNTTAYVSNVGDSRTYLYREGEGLKKVTNDHSVVASLVEAGIIKPDDIYTHPKRNQIYRSLGEKPMVEVDSFTVHLQPGDKLLLCSDGLWDMVRDPKIESVIKSPAPDPSITAGELIKVALEGGGEDNVSVIVVSAIETAQKELVPSFQLIDKPESVQVPQM